MNNLLDKLPHDEMKEFLEYKAAVNPPELATISKKITSDLVQSRLRLALLYIFFSTIGYLVTLAICSQGKVGLSFFSHSNSSAIMQTFPDPWCSVLCGVLFSGIPFVLSVALLNRFQRRFLIFRMFWLPLVLSAIGCVAILCIGRDFTEIDFGSLNYVWVLSAVITPYLGEAILSRLLRQRTVKI